MCFFDGDIRELGTVPGHLLDKIEEALQSNPSVWAEEDKDKPNKVPVFENTVQHVVFQFPQDMKSHKRSHYRPVWSGWQDLIEPVIEHTTSCYRYKKGRTARIMLAKLAAGRAIDRHIDTFPAARVPHKIHVPIVTDAGVAFFGGDTIHHLERGLAYEVNNRIPHGAANNASIDRVHLIFDYFNDLSFPERILRKFRHG